MLEREFPYADIRKINKCLNAMKNLAKSDYYFANAIAEFEIATGADKVYMCKRLLEIYNTTDFDVMTLEDAIILSSYVA